MILANVPVAPSTPTRSEGCGMKRSPLSRRTPLRREQIQAARDEHETDRHSQRRRQRNTDPPPATTALVHTRDGSCVRCGTPGHAAWPPHAQHHRRPRGAGGTRRDSSNSPENLILLCARCHAWVESHRNLARADGYLVEQAQDPALVPLVWHGRQSFLRADGTVVPWGTAA